jgi:hypothetical protein
MMVDNRPLASFFVIPAMVAGRKFGLSANKDSIHLSELRLSRTRYVAVFIFQMKVKEFFMLFDPQRTFAK